MTSTRESSDIAHEQFTSEDLLRERLRAIASAPVLLVTTDYDGTLSPIVDDPAAAKPNRESIIALKTLSNLSQTHVAVVSGRALKELATMTGLTEKVMLVGSHGSEFEPDFAAKLPADAARRRAEVLSALREIASRHPGFLIEEKPASIAFHYRNAPEDVANKAVRDIEQGPAAQPEVMIKRGKMVIELSVVHTSKGDALERIRHRVGASAAIFLGDDVTDEDAFATLKGPDLAIKVGEGETCASLRVRDTVDVARVLAQLSEMREEWLRGFEAVPIEHYSMLSDQRTCALVSPEGRVSWFCAPRADSSAIFAELLGGMTAGHFTIRPDHEHAKPLGQRYLGDSLVLETAWRDFTITDYLDCSGGRPSQRAGRVDLVRVVEGSGRVVVEFAPRPDFGRARTSMRRVEGGLEVEDMLDPIVLRAPGVEWEMVTEGVHQTARAVIELRPGRPLELEMRFGAGSANQQLIREDERRRQTQRFWSSWAAQLRLPNVEPELVRRSALTIKGLCHGPTGGILAAATTSLPEHVGGVRNWDYRYCWLRDAAMSAAALVKLGSVSEAMRFLDWMLGVIDHVDSPERLHPLYTVTGGSLGPEAEISELAGYRGSRPVRVGNAASRQLQLDVFGPIVDLVWLLQEREAPLSSEHWRLVEAMVGAVERRWSEPDHGIWEIRGPRRHHVYSKLMCWLAADRGAKIAERFLGRKRDDWTALRDTIATEILEKGWCEEKQAYAAAYDLMEHDASVLTLGTTGFLPPNDERFAKTVRGIEETLRLGPAVYRYRYDDNLPGPEGAFHLCTAWLVQAMLHVGRVDDAWALFDEMAKLAGPTGLLSEQWGPRTHRALGNHPQAFSHLGIIEAAVRLSEAG